MPTHLLTHAKAIRIARARVRKLAKAQAAETKASNAIHNRLATHDPRGPRPELIRGAQREDPPEVPTLTLPLSPEFVGPELTIHRPEDLGRFVDKFCGEPYRPGIPHRYFCIRHATRDERTLTLVDYPGHPVLVHCSRCGLRLSVLEFLQDLYPDQEEFLTVVRQLWPEQVQAGQVNASEFHRLKAQSIRRAVLEAGRFSYAASVVRKEIEPSFGDWSVVPFEALAEILARESIPLEMPPDWYLLNVLRTLTGEIAALDVYREDYEPLFRSWLSIEASVTRPELFAVPTWCDYCDRSRERFLCTNCDDAHKLERQAAMMPVASRQPIWLRCPPQPLEPVLREPYHVSG